MPYEDDRFDILLSAHFLFLYSDTFDYDFHIETIEEMLRVTKEELRIFPLVDMEGKRYKALDKVIAYLNERGCTTEEIEVDYEFQKNANTYLKVKVK
ncbi:hypothetical protein [Mammaliicoccus sp. Dog046]|uniref:hypothetical protein n=1 Tax=Mammaliicoccus sp. Dog046 TaxID=3034233 RepID=UPI002B260561|nr:hypothetical protein [Mammaliicoccus sp. Dog046]WQK85413.1 hypothetical protein P3U32_12525 [Mammaliicoccus sp. Dog046]